MCEPNLSIAGYVDADDIEYNEICGDQAVYHGEVSMNKVQGLGSNIEDPSSCYQTIAEIQRCVITLEQEHIQYMRSIQRKTVIGSIDTPIGDESSADLIRNMHRSSERLSRHGSRSSNASNISRRSFRGNRSRGGSFRERDKTKHEGEGVRKSLSGDVSVSSKNLAVDHRHEVRKAASYDVMAVESHPVDVKGHQGLDADGGEDIKCFSSGHNLLVDQQRSPRKSTGFFPPTTLDPMSARDSGHSYLDMGYSNGSIQSLNNHNELSCSSHSTSGVLETSLETNDAVTTLTFSSNLASDSIRSETCQPECLLADNLTRSDLGPPVNSSPPFEQPNDLNCQASDVPGSETRLGLQHNEMLAERPHDFREPLRVAPQSKPALMSSNSLDLSRGEERPHQVFRRQLSHPTSSELSRHQDSWKK